MTVQHELERFEVVSYQLDEDHMQGTEQVGEITLQFIGGEQVTNAIWFDEDGNHYFCWVDGDDTEDGLLSDFTNYVAPELCPICLTNELDLDEDMTAICRKDNSTVICSDCGQTQAMEELGLCH